jgi:cytochrome c oxidase subunit 2
MGATVAKHFSIVLLLILGATAGSSRSAAQTQSARVIEITAERFEFWPAEITIAEGERIELQVRSHDTLHGFRLVGGGINLLIPKRGKGYATAIVDGLAAGRYTFECSRMCGAGHNFMRGELIVRSKATGDRP